MTARLCASCGKPLTTGAKRWHQGCIPPAFYRENLQRANRIAVCRRRRSKFAVEIGRMLSARGTLTREALEDFGATVFDRGWHLGYNACEAKWRRRQREAA